MTTSTQADRDISTVDLLKQILFRGLTAEQSVKEKRQRGEDVTHISQTLQKDGFRLV